MTKKLTQSKSKLLAFTAALSLISMGQQPVDASHSAAEKSTLTYEGEPRAIQKKSQYDELIEKIETWKVNTSTGPHSVTASGDDLTVRLSSKDIDSVVDSIKKIKQYRDAVEKQCKGIDDSASLLVNTIDFCLVNNVIFPAVSKSGIEQNSFQTKISANAVNTCNQELAAFFAEKEKKTDLTEKNLFLADAQAAEALSLVFRNFGASKDAKNSKVSDSSELVKSIKKVTSSNLCQVKLENQAKPGQDSSKVPAKPKSDFSSESHKEQNRSDFEESIEESTDIEEIYEPIAPKKIVEPAKPATQPTPAPVYQAPQKPTYEPAPYQPAPYKPKRYEPTPAPRQKNTPPPFIPAANPAPRRAVVGGPGPVPVAGVPIARSFGLSLGFGSYNSTFQAVPPPMPYYPMPMQSQMPMMGGGMGGISGVSSAPRACLVCSSTPTVMPTLGLGTMIARPCPVRTVGVQPVGACLPNMNQPVMGYPGVNVNQIPRYPGAPVVTGPVTQPSIAGGRVTPSRTTIPRTNPSLVKRTQRRGVRK